MPSNPADRPNVLFYFTDQQRWDTVGCYGNPMDLTPNLDALARRGVRFENAFTCQPVCAPARGSLQTGQFPTSHGVFRNGLALSVETPTVATLFSNSGYRTAYIGKWHLAGGHREDAVPPELRGGYDDVWEAADALEFTSHPTEGRIFNENGDAIEFSGQYRVDFLTDRAEIFLRDSQDAPFFLFLSHLEPHHQNDMDRYVAPDGYAERFANPWIPEDLRNEPGDWHAELPDYYGCVARLDECVGRLLSVLENIGQLENTVVVFTTDHGSHFRTRNPEYKRSCHDASIRIPLVMAGPGLPKGAVVDDLVSLIDVPPTLLDAAGIRVPKSFQGASLLNLAHGTAETWPDEVFFQISEAEVGRGIRTRQWKYSVYAPDADPWNDPSSDTYVERYLYDLRSDPHETVNLVGRAGRYRDVADQLGEALVRRIDAVGESRPEIVKARYYA